MHVSRAYLTEFYASFAINAFSYTVLKTIEGIIISINLIFISRYYYFIITSLFLNSSVVNINASFEIPDLRLSTESFKN